jgi:hypothetical protein
VATQAAFLFVCTPIVFRILWGGALQIGENGDRPTRLSLNCAHDIVARLSSSWVPWLKLKRNTSAAASNKARIISELELAGPSVATIFA